MRLKHTTLSAKLPINADNKSWGVAWMKCKGAAFLHRSTIQIRHLWEDYLHEVLPNQIETYLVKTWSTRSPPRNGVLLQQRNVSHSMLGIVTGGYAKPGRRDSILRRTAKSLSVQHANLVNITFITVSESKYKKTLASKLLLVTKQPWWFCVKSGVDSSSCVSIESRIWQMDIYVVQWASIGPPREIFLGGTKLISGL